MALNYGYDPSGAIGVCLRAVSLCRIFLRLSSELRGLHLIHVKQLFDGEEEAKEKRGVMWEDEWRMLGTRSDGFHLSALLADGMCSLPISCVSDISVHLQVTAIIYLFIYFVLFVAASCGSKMRG